MDNRGCDWRIPECDGKHKRKVDTGIEAHSSVATS